MCWMGILDFGVTSIDACFLIKGIKQLSWRSPDEIISHPHKQKHFIVFTSQLASTWEKQIQKYHSHFFITPAWYQNEDILMNLSPHLHFQNRCNLWPFLNTICKKIKNKKMIIILLHSMHCLLPFHLYSSSKDKHHSEGTHTTQKQTHVSWYFWSFLFFSLCFLFVSVFGWPAN